MTGVQTCALPIFYETGAAERGLLETHVDELRSVGFEIEPFSGNSFAISTIPTLLKRESVERFFRKLLDAAASLMGAHVLEGRPATDVIDELEKLFRERYEAYRGPGQERQIDERGNRADTS